MNILYIYFLLGILVKLSLLPVISNSQVTIFSLNM
jgi:hypothetical protein